MGKLSSEKTQIPYPYYKLKFCSANNTQIEFDNLGEALTGDVYQHSPYEVLTI